MLPSGCIRRSWQPRRSRRVRPVPRRIATVPRPTIRHSRRCRSRAIFSRVWRATAPFGEPVVVGNIQEAREDLWKIAAVVSRTDRCPIGHRLHRNQIAPPDFRPIKSEHARGLVGEPFQHITGLGAARAAICVCRQSVGEYPDRLHRDSWRTVDARRAEHCRCAWDAAPKVET